MEIKKMDIEFIENVRFNQGFRGYDTSEVDNFLDVLIRQANNVNTTIGELERLVEQLQHPNVRSIRSKPNNVQDSIHELEKIVSQLKNQLSKR